MWAILLTFLVTLKLMWLADIYNVSLSVSGHDAFHMGDSRLLHMEWKYIH
jgi:hypothetical protein